MPTLNQMFSITIIPAIACGALYITAVFVRSRILNKNSLLWLTAVSIAIGYLIGYITIERKITLLPREGIHWLFYFAVFALFSSTYWDAAGLRRTISQVIYSIIIPRILLDALFKHTWGTFQGIIWWIFLSVAIYVLWNIVIQSFNASTSNTSVPFIYLSISGGTALVLALSGSLRLAQHAGTLVALFAAIWIITLIFQHKIQANNEINLFIFPQSVSPLLTFLLIGIWMNGYFYGEAPAISVLLLAISPVFTLIGKINVLQGLMNKKPVLIQLGLITLCIGIAVILAVFRSGMFGQDTYY